MTKPITLLAALLLAVSSACGAVEPGPPDQPGDDVPGDDVPGDDTPPGDDAPPLDCVTAADCTDPGFPVCLNNACVECADAAACSADAPVCSADHVCDACVADTDCAAYSDTPACGPAGACVECTADSQCDAHSPVCGDDNTCRGCIADAECASDACNFTTGACYPPAQVVYVAPGGATATPCGGIAAPCGTLTAAATMVSTARPIIRMRAATYPAQTVLSATAPFVVHGGGATIAVSGFPSGAAALFTGNGIDGTFLGLAINVSAPAGGSGYRAVYVGTGTTVTLRDLAIRGTGAGTEGVQSSGTLIADRLDIQTAATAVHAFSGSLTLEHSRIHQGGGIYIGAHDFRVVDNLITYSTAVGVTIDSPLGTTASRKLLAFNTLLANGSQVVAGATELDVIRVVFADSHLRFSPYANLYANARPHTWSGATGIRLIAGTTPIFSLLDEPNLPPSADTNLYAPAGLGTDGHLTPTSPAIDAVAPASGITDDVDGGPRPVGANADIGADEYAP